MSDAKALSLYEELIKKSPLTLSPGLAEQIGLNEAIVIQQLQYWLARNEERCQQEGRSPADDDRFVDGHWWAYNTYKAWRDTNFPFWSEATIKRIFGNLEKNGLVISRKFRTPASHVKSYTIDYEKLRNTKIFKRNVVNKKNKMTGKSNETTAGTGHNDQFEKVIMTRGQNDQLGGDQSDQFEQVIMTNSSIYTETMLTETKDPENTERSLNSVLTHTHSDPDPDQSACVRKKKSKKSRADHVIQSELSDVEPEELGSGICSSWDSTPAVISNTPSKPAPSEKPRPAKPITRRIAAEQPVGGIPEPEPIPVEPEKPLNYGSSDKREVIRIIMHYLPEGRLHDKYREYVQAPVVDAERLADRLARKIDSAQSDQISGAMANDLRQGELIPWMDRHFRPDQVFAQWCGEQLPWDGDGKIPPKEARQKGQKYLFNAVRSVSSLRKVSSEWLLYQQELSAQKIPDCVNPVGDLALAIVTGETQYRHQDLNTYTPLPVSDLEDLDLPEYEGAIHPGCTEKFIAEFKLDTNYRSKTRRWTTLVKAGYKHVQEDNYRFAEPVIKELGGLLANKAFVAGNPYFDVKKFANLFLDVHEKGWTELIPAPFRKDVEIQAARRQQVRADVIAATA